MENKRNAKKNLWTLYAVHTESLVQLLDEKKMKRAKEDVDDG